jgi:hypothetical protein
MRDLPLAITMSVLLLAPALASSPIAAQSQSDSVSLRAGLKVRILGTSLGSGWHEGRLVRMEVTGAGECFAFEPAAPSHIAAITLDSSDSLEVWLGHASTDSSVARADTTRPQGQWVGVSRSRWHSLSLGCRTPGR